MTVMDGMEQRIEKLAYQSASSLAKAESIFSNVNTNLLSCRGSLGRLHKILNRIVTKLKHKKELQVSHA